MVTGPATARNTAPRATTPPTTPSADTGPTTRPTTPRPAHAHTPPRETVYRPRGPLDLALTVGVQQRGAHDPTMTVARHIIWRAARTPDGVATLALRQAADGSVQAAAWGPGDDWALAHVPALCGAADDLSGFDASRHPVVADAHHRLPGLRLGRTDLVFDALVGAILEQKVTGIQAFGAWRTLVTRFGERAPGPTPRALYAPPTVDGWRRIPSWAWHRAGVEPPQSRTVVTAARQGNTLAAAALAAPDGPTRDRALTAVRGVGPWTAAETRIRALGDADAVSVNDVHLPHDIGYALTGRRTDDAGMLALLDAWPGHRQRVIRLIMLAGPREPRRGPRLAPEDHRNR